MPKLWNEDGMVDFDETDTKSRLRAGRLTLTEELIKALHDAGESKFLKLYYSGQYDAWLRTQPQGGAGDDHVEDAGDREHHPAGKVADSPHFKDVDAR